MIPGLGNSPGEGIGYSLQYSSLENPHGQRSLASYSPLGYKESEHDWETNTYFTHNIIELVTNDFTLMCCPPGHLFFCFSGDSEVYREWSDLK